jgi:hypothetical protein
VEAFLAGLSTRDLVWITKKHLGQKYDSKRVSRIVARATTEPEAWRRRSLRGQLFCVLNHRAGPESINWCVCFTGSMPPTGEIAEHTTGHACPALKQL